MITSSLSPADIQKLRQLQADSVGVSYGECVAVHWPQPTGTVYYATTRYDLAPNFPEWPFKPLEARLFGKQAAADAVQQPPEYLPFSLTHEINDDSIQLAFVNGTETQAVTAQGIINQVHETTITELFERHPEGAKVELLGFFSAPEANFKLQLPPLWWGLLNPPSEISGGIVKTSATFGYRSTQGLLPRRLMSATKCQAIFPPESPNMTLTEIEQDNACPFSLHVGGTVGNLDPATGLPYASCPKNSRAICHARIGGDIERLPFLAFESILGSETVTNSKGANTIATTKGNESALNVPCPVIFGERKLRALPVLTYQIQTSAKKPENGTISAVFAVSDSQVESITEPKINGTPVTVAPGTNRNQFLYNLGERQQSPLNLTGTQKAANYSKVAHWRGLIFGSFAGQSAGNFSGECTVRGNNEIKVYSDRTTFAKQYSTNRAWCLYWLLMNRIAGEGDSGTLYEIDDWLELAARCDDSVGYEDSSGAFFTGTRATFNCQVEGRSTQQVIRDICLAGRFSLPFAFEGKKRIFLLKEETLDDSIPVFRDRHSAAGHATIIDELRISKLQPYQQPNQITVWFEDEAHENIRRPLVFEYQDLQEARGRALGDSSQQILTKEYTAFGVTKFGEAVRFGNLIGDLGEFDSGGVKNPIRVAFTLFSALAADALALHPYKVIKIESPYLAPFRETTGEACEYFRILTMTRNTNGTLSITAQWYPRGYYARIEDASQPPPMSGSAGSGARAEVPI